MGWGYAYGLEKSGLCLDSSTQGTVEKVEYGLSPYSTTVTTISKGKNLFDPSSQLLLYHVNVTTINEFQEVVEATVDLGSKLKIDLEVNYPLLSGLDLFSLNELMSSTN